MALLGFHIVLSLIAATLYNKLGPDFKACDWLVWRGLKYFWLPEPQDNSENKKLRKRGVKAQDVDFKTSVLCVDMNFAVMGRLTFFNSLQWMVNYGVLSLVVFCLSQLWCFLLPLDDSTNVSVLWCLFSISFSVQSLCKILWMKISKTELSSERNLVISFSLLAFLFFAVINVFGDRFLSDNLGQCFDYLMENSRSIAANVSSFKFGKSSPILLFMFASFTAALLCAILMLPLVQYALLFKIAAERDSSFMSIIHKLVFILPYLILPLYLAPVQKIFLDQISSLDSDIYSTVRNALVITWSLLRILTLKSLLQAYLLNAWEKAQAFTKHPEAFESLRSHLSLLAMTALQLLSPAVLILFVSLAEIGLGQLTGVRPSPVVNNLQVLLDYRVQRVFWAYLNAVLLTLHVVLSSIGLTFS
ncbi:unnamed protein product [Bursaphelenchus okinawaensis]|uniref:G_PROTEIN_RECEP_F1_2 domain-containing protein n=1 Tax=Bursaphelenchus okinawaensis TaxID=465554 RepID=A0A811L4U8_9BILA|nr:unnamed protein product [Bursaphelenchus okinawaensis]CAG9119736.1 unnamed protein product [Bursaphelenchus okinawaensis]